MKTIVDHAEIVRNIASEIKKYLESDRKKKLNFFHGGTNSTRDQSDTDKYYFIDISNFNDVLEVNTEHKYALVEPNVSMDKLVKATLEYGLVPPVVMEFPGITAGGAVNGGTLEASSYKYGQFNDNCLEYEIVLGNGEIIHASEKENEDLFYGLSGSYGSLGLLTLIKVKLIPAKSYVKAIFTPCGNYQDAVRALQNEVNKAEANFVDTILYDPEHGVIITGFFSDKKDEKVETFSKASDEWFYERGKKVIEENKAYEELIPIVDFLFRYNRGAYWMGDYVFSLMHVPDDRLTKTIFNPFMNTRKLYEGLHELNISQNYFIQDFYCPIENTIEFLKESERKLDIFPIWLCPMKPTQTLQKLSPQYINTELIIDIGIWGQSKKYLAHPIGLNMLFESIAKRLKARKMLYAHTYYSERHFWKIYDCEWYNKLRKKYQADSIFPDVWFKTHVSFKKYSTHMLKGMFHMFLDVFQSKHLNP